MTVKTKEGVGTPEGREKDVKEKSPKSFNESVSDVTSNINEVLENPIVQRLTELAGLDLTFVDDITGIVGTFRTAKEFFGSNIATLFASDGADEDTPVSLSELGRVVVDIIQQAEAFTNQDLIPGDVESEILLLAEFFEDPEQFVLEMTRDEWDDFDEISDSLKDQILQTIYVVLLDDPEEEELREKLIVINGGVGFENAGTKKEELKKLFRAVFNEFASKILLPGIPIINSLEEIEDLANKIKDTISVVEDIINSFKEEDEEDESKDVMSTFDKALTAFELIATQVTLFEEIFKIKLPLPSLSDLAGIARSIQQIVEIYQTVRLGIDLAINLFSSPSDDDGGNDS